MIYPIETNGFEQWKSEKLSESSFLCQALARKTEIEKAIIRTILLSLRIICRKVIDFKHYQALIYFTDIISNMICN